MLVEEKYFNQDKNYLLKSVQAFSKEILLDQWIKQVFEAYNEMHNPMGLEDDFIIELRKSIHKGRKLLEDNYDLVAGIYRYSHSDNQLEFNWDGRSHMETYDEEWKAMYRTYIVELSRLKEVQRSVIKYAIHGDESNTIFLVMGIRRTILSHFKFRLRSQSLSVLSA